MSALARARTPEALVLALVALWIAFFPDRMLGANGAAHFGQAYRIVHDHVLDIDPFVEHTPDWSRFGDHYYPGKAPGLSLLTVPVLALLVGTEGWLGLDAAAIPVTNAYLSNLVVNGLLAAVAGAALVRLLRGLGLPGRASVAAALAVTLGTAYLPYATADHYSHTPAAAFLVLAALAAFEGARDRDERVALRRAALAGLLAGVAVLVEYACAPAVPILAVYLAARTRRARPVVAFLAGGSPMALVFAWYHATCFGSPFALAYHYLNPAFPDAGSARLGRVPDPRVLLELTVLPFRGTFFFSPVLALGFVGLARARSSPIRPELAVGAAFFALLLLANAGFKDWEGGYTTGPRYLVPALPLLAPLVALGLERAPRVGAALLTVSIVHTLAIVYVCYDMPNVRLETGLFAEVFPELATGDRNPLGTIYPLFAAGRHVRDNMGHLVGLPGLSSLLPLLVASGAIVWRLELAVRETSPRPTAPPA